MNATKEQLEQTAMDTLPALAVPDAERAISIVNGWLHRDVAMLIHVSSAVFNAATYCWHLPIELAYPITGRLGVIGDVYLRAATGEFVGRPVAEELQCRATALAKVHGFTEEDEDDEEAEAA